MTMLLLLLLYVILVLVIDIAIWVALDAALTRFYASERAGELEGSDRDVS